MRYNVPDERQRAVMERNGIRPAGFTVESQSETSFTCLNFKTRDRVMIMQGDKPWDSYGGSDGK